MTKALSIKTTYSFIASVQTILLLCTPFATHIANMDVCEIDENVMNRPKLQYCIWWHLHSIYYERSFSNILQQQQQQHNFNNNTFNKFYNFSIWHFLTTVRELYWQLRHVHLKIEPSLTDQRKCQEEQVDLSYLSLSLNKDAINSCLGTSHPDISVCMEYCCTTSLSSQSRTCICSIGHRFRSFCSFIDAAIESSQFVLCLNVWLDLVYIL